MPHEFVVFLSYSWQRTDEFAHLKGALDGLDDVEVVSDHHLLAPGDPLWERISRGIDSADLIVVLLTEQALRSHEIRDELTRAHDRGKPILSVCEVKEPEFSFSGRVPHFLRNALFIQFSTGKFRECLPEVIETIRGRADAANIDASTGQMLKKFAELRRTIVGSVERHERSSSVANRIVSNILDSTLSESQQVFNDQFEVDLGREHDFLKRAGPLFGSANEVTAVTLEWISDFWTDQKNKLNAIDYLKGQSPTTIRLFVFDKPEPIAKFEEILDANYLQYGQRGAVLVTSKTNYKQLLQRFCYDQADFGQLLCRDFGYLEYEQSSVFAWLDSSKLAFRNIRFGVPFYVDIRSFKHVMTTFASDATARERAGVLRWGRRTDENIGPVVDTLFGTIRDEVVHVVMIRGDIVVEKLAQLTRKIEDLDASEMSALGCVAVWYGKVSDFQARDRVLFGQLKHGRHYDYLIYMRFDSEESLRTWYEHVDHSSIRREIYELICPETIPLFNQAECAISCKDTHEAEKIFVKIESLVVPEHLVRFDFIKEQGPVAVRHVRRYEFFNSFQNRAELDN